MPTISFDLSASAQTEMVTALCALNGYQPTINGAANPESPAQFARRIVRNFMRDSVMHYRRQQAALAANTADPDIT